jgi:DNA-binding NarL/FixJ family response regulator
MKSNDPVTVLIVDDHKPSLLELKALLQDTDDLIVVGEAFNGEHAIRKAVELRPTIVLMEIVVPLLNGIEATKRIKQLVPEAKVLIVTNSDDDRSVFTALAAGADGYCLKSILRNRLVSAIYAITAGAAWLDPGIAQRVLKAISTTYIRVNRHCKPKSKLLLSENETAVLRLLVEGLSNREIADRLDIATDTVKIRVRSILDRLAVSGRTQAAVLALRRDLIS